MNTKQFLIIGLGSALLLAPVLAHARQDQDQGQESVADAARKAQAEKKVAPKSKLSIDNDNLDTLTGTVSVVGQAPAPPADQAKAAANPAAATDNKSPVKDEAYWRKAFADANKRLSDDEHELDILQREYNLKQEQYYTDPTAALKQEYSRQDLNDQKAKIDDKTAVVATDKQAISDLEDQLRQAGGDPGWATPPPQAPASDTTQPETSAPQTPAPATPAQP